MLRTRAALPAIVLVALVAACLPPPGDPRGEASDDDDDEIPPPDPDAGPMIVDGDSDAFFTFFVTSLLGLQTLSGSANGFGGDLRFGETGAGAGLRGADAICAALAEESLPGASAKPWRAFLSATADENGDVVHAIERIGEGPWYDRLGRRVADKKADLLYDRPSSADAEIQNDLPNELGVPNHQPDPTLPEVDNHHMLTGSNQDGELYDDDGEATCADWTSSLGSDGRPRVGLSWPRGGGGGPGGGGGGMENANWISALDESGCAPGINILSEGPAPPGSNTVGAGGGYGGFYCFVHAP